MERNLRGPLAGLGSELRVAVRTGDTPQRDRAAMLREHPDILITTPESFYLLLTSRGREMLKSVETLILDEVHAVAGTKRGAHMALSVERLDRLTEKPVQRVGLSATQRPMEEIGRFVSGGRPIELVDAGRAKELDLKVVVPLEDMREPGESGSIWPSIYPEILELVRQHRSTIVFVNNRRLAERLALRLNDLANEDVEDGERREIARAHHGSLAREQRLEIEELLKKGEIPCLVATSSLELGIDMGAVDLVVQVESPKSVARGLQRVGRAGHELGAVSRGRIFPKYRADLLESAVVVERMKAGAIEETVIPRNPLDVLAQQIVAITADEEISVDELHDLVRGAYNFADLSRVQLENVLDMLAGRYPSDEFAELRPRIVWDRTAGVIRGRGGVRQLAVQNAGTIPDRGLYGVHLVDGGGRVGELDEEMVYEARAGQTFLLGASTWRIEEITRDRVLVSPAPGVPGMIPFWKGEGPGRPYELGEQIGRASRELVALPEQKALERLTSEHSLDEQAARNLLTFLGDQQNATGAVPSDRTVVVERFRDEIGDWRMCVLTPFGARVHAPWSMAIGVKLRDALGIEAQSLWSDDGIAIHLPDADAPPPTEELLIDPTEIEDLVMSELASTALFGSRFRENAGRALLIPRRRPGERTPLWQQRLKAQGLLQVARKYGSFPVILETYRECLQDVFDLPALKRLLNGLKTRQLDLVDVETASASPYSTSLLFDYVANYMYEDDTPRAERRAQVLSLDRDLLKELLGQEELRDLLDPGALEEVEEQLRGAPRNAGSAARRAPAPRRPAAGSVRPSARAAAPRRAAGDHGAGRRRGASDRGRGRGPLPRRSRRDASGRAARDVPRRRVGFAGEPGRALREGPRAVHDRPGERSFRHRRRAGAARSGARGAARSRRASPGRHGARVVRPGRPAATAPRLARSLAQGGRAGRAGCAREVPAQLAGDRQALEPAGGARPAAGARAAGFPVGERGSAAARSQLPARLARPALRDRRARLGRAPVSTGSRSTSETTRRCSVAWSPPIRPRARCPTGSARCSDREPSSGSTCSPRPSSRRSRRCPHSGISCGRAR